MDKRLLRLQNFFQKIKKGQDVKLVTLGGSITSGFYCNSFVDKGWPCLIVKWLKEICRENSCNLSFINAGITGTDSSFGIARLPFHVLSKNPDLVIIDYALNDQWLCPEIRKRTYEAIIRRLIEDTSAAVFSIFVNEKNLPYNYEDEEKIICDYYSVPYLNWREEFIKENSLRDFEVFFDKNDYIHPNKKGHRSISNYIIKFLSEIYNSLPEKKVIGNLDSSLPPALNDTDYLHTNFYTSEELEPIENSGWKLGSPIHPEWKKLGHAAPGFESEIPGAEISFEVYGSSVGITYAESDAFTCAEAWITKSDGSESPKVRLDCYVAFRTGYYGWAYRELYKSSISQNYIVHIKVGNYPEAINTPKLANFTGIVTGGF